MLTRYAKKGDRKVGELCPAEDEGQEAPKGEEGQEDGEEAREVKAPPIPDTPSREQVRIHRLTHRPFRSWCPHCIRGKGRSDQHRQSSQKDVHSEIPKIVSDYFFVGQRRPKEREERESRPRGVPSKRARHQLLF